MNNRFHFRWIIPATLVCAALALQGCGGGDDDDPDENATISGKVLGSLVEGAVVCVDENENGRCDSTDQHRIFSTADGSYQIADVPTALFNRPLVVEVPQTAMVVDPVSGARSPVATEYRLGYPPSDTGERFVSSLSTLVNSEFLRQGDLANATATVAERLTDAGVGADGDTLLDDYVASATDSGASADDIGLYNVAKLAGQVMRVSQAGTAGNAGIDASALMMLVAQKVFDRIDDIEQIARENQTLINQAAAAAMVDGIGETGDLAIGEADIASASQLAALSFDLGPVAYANVLNFKEGNAAAEWRRVSYIRFMTPGGADGRDVHDYRASIPDDYELGILDAAGDLRMTVGFDEAQWQNGGDPQVWYGWEDDSSVLAVYTRAAAGAWDEGEYQYVLCPQGCDGGQRIHLANTELAPYDLDLDIGGGARFAALDDLVENDLQFIASAGEGLRDGDNQQVTIAQPSPPQGTTYNIYLGIDDDNDGFPDSSRSQGTDRSVNRLLVPVGWLDQPHDFVTQVSHRDRPGWKNVSWEARSDYVPTQVARRSSFAVDEFFDVYLAEYSDGDDFREGADTILRAYLEPGATLTGMHYEDDAGNVVATICLPANIPASQPDLATYHAEHHGDGVDSYFDGCQNFNLYDEFGLNDGEDYWSQITLQGSTGRYVDAEILEIEVYLQQEDSDGSWNEAGSAIGDLRYVVLEFDDGSEGRYPLDLYDPPFDHDLTDHGNPGISVCSVDGGLARIGWTPPNWMLDEFNAGTLSVNLGVYPRDTDDNSLPRYTHRSRIGATSTLLSKDFVQSLGGGEAIGFVQLRAAIGDMDYVNWKNRSYWTKLWQNFSAEEFFNAPPC